MSIAARVFLFPALLLVGALVAGCGQEAKEKKPAGQGQTPIRIAVACPMTGSGAAFGEMIQAGAKLKAREVNAAGGIAGRKLELVVEDDRGDTSEATNVARKIASDKSICLVVGHFNSTCSNAAKDTYNRVGIVQFSPGSTNVDVCRGSPWTFRNLYRDDYQGTFQARYARNVLKLSKVAVFYDNDDYGKGLMQSFCEEAAKVGLEVVAREAYIRERTQDFKTPLIKVKALAPDGVFVSGLYNEAALIIKTARQDLGMNVVFMGGDGLANDTLVKIAGAAAEGTYITTPFLFNTGQDSPEAKEFFAKFKQAAGRDPDTWAALTYDAVGMAVGAIRAVGDDRARIKEWFAASTAPEKGYRGVTGLTYFDREGDCYSKPAYVARVKNGQFLPAEKQLLDIK